MKICLGENPHILEALNCYKMVGESEISSLENPKAMKRYERAFQTR